MRQADRTPILEVGIRGTDSRHREGRGMGSSRGERTPSHWRAGRIIMTSALVLWATCTVVFWWLWGVGLDAADSLRPDPPVMVLYLPSLVIGSVAFAVFFLTLGVGVVRRRRPATPCP